MEQARRNVFPAEGSSFVHHLPTRPIVVDAAASQFHRRLEPIHVPSPTRPLADHCKIHGSAAVALSFAVAADNPPAKEDNKHPDLKQVQGAWDVVRHAVAGTGFGKRDVSGERIGPQVTITGEVVTFHYPQAPADKKSVYTINNFDATTTPKQIDVAFEKGGELLVRKGIYSLEGDLIKCEFAQPGRPRPEKFDAHHDVEHATNLLMLRRARQGKEVGRTRGRSSPTQQ